MAAPKTEKWTARENVQPKDSLLLIVSGLVQVSDANETPQLTERTGRPKQLELELTITDSSDPGIEVPVWKQASYSTDVTADQYDSVRIMWQDFIVADVPIVDDAEHVVLGAAQSKTQNATVKIKTKAPKKSAAKKVVKGVVAAVEDLAKGARKALKTVFKKAPKKKAAKKAVKKAKAAKTSAKKTVKKVAKKVAKNSTSYGRKVKKVVKKVTKKAKKHR